MKITLLLFSIFLSIVIYANIHHIDGISGVTKKDGGFGCQCHSVFSTDSVYVWIEGPDTVYTRDSAHYKIIMTGGPSVAGGFDLAIYFGTLRAIDTLAKIKDGDLTHTMPKPFFKDTVSWNFKYFAPDSVLMDTLYATAISCNGDSIPTELDQWNHADNFIVNIIDEPVYVQNILTSPTGYLLLQNYPNPFNPNTKIGYRIAESEFVSLKVYDILGNEVVTLTDEYKSAGKYEVDFNGTNFISGVYFYSLQTETYAQIRKMVLLK